MMDDQSAGVGLWTSVGGTIALILTGVIGWFANRHKRDASASASAAESSASDAAIFANEAIQRALALLEKRVDGISRELEREKERSSLLAAQNGALMADNMRLKSRMQIMESYIASLVHMMKKEGLEAPPLHWGGADAH